MPRAPARTYFGSIATLVIAGFAVTALPLIIALVAGSIQVNQLTRQSEHTILQSAQATRASEFVADELVSMERNARQYAVLKDPALLRIYKERFAQLLDTLRQLENLGLGSDNGDKLGAIGRLSTEITLAIEQDPMDQKQVAEALDHFTQLRQYALDLRQASDAAMDREVAALTSRSKRVQHAFLWQSILLGMFGLALAVAFVPAILRPLRQINQAIARLGEERLDTPIAIDGPRDLREIGERLEWLRQQLLQVEQQKNEFVRHMSHELKTPLANIRESTGLLLDNTVGQVNDGQRDILAILDSSGRRLHLLVDNLINLARWREQHAMSVTSFDVSTLISNEAAGHRLLLERKSLSLTISKPPTLMVAADRERIKTLIANLLSNAIKYSPEHGEITITVEAEGKDLILEVSDQGPGIAAAEVEKVFEPFYQSTSRLAVEGTGIGLSLVRECVEAHGGSGEFLPCKSGAHFRACLPIVEQDVSHA